MVYLAPPRAQERTITFPFNIWGRFTTYSVLSQPNFSIDTVASLQIPDRLYEAATLNI